MSEPSELADSLATKSIEELDAILRDPTLLEPSEPAPEKEPETVVSEPIPEPEKEPDPIEPEIDVAAERQAIWESEKKAMEAQLDLQRAHASRLAGEIGHLRKAAMAPRTEPARSESYEEPVPVDHETRSRLDKLESELRKRDKDIAIASAVGQLNRPEYKEMEAEFKEAMQKFGQDWTDALDTEDPETARLMATRVANAVIAEAEKIKTLKERTSRLEKKAASVSEIEKAKKKSAISSSGSAPAAPQPKRYEDMTPGELDTLLKGMTSGR
jgi:hypothetical protein